MAIWTKYIKQSIRGRITSMMVASFVLILIGAAIAPWGTFQTMQRYDRTTSDLRASQEYITEIANHTNEIILRVRGYFAYLDSYEYEQIFNAKAELDKSLALFKQIQLTSEGQGLIQRVENFFDDYLDSVLPKGAAFAESGDYESLRKLITLGANNPVNEILLYAQNSEKQIRAKLDAESARLLQNLLYQGAYLIVYIVIVLLLFIVVTKRLATDIGNPLSRLSHYALNYSRGETIQEDLLNRMDEIGGLSRSLNNMIYEIQEKEEELLAQNEELQAQQDELQAQQDELQEALRNMEENETYLNKRNLLTQSLANTLDKDELLASIIRHVVEITQMDKGIVLLMNGAEDCASYGISQEETLQFLGGFYQGPAIRAMASKQLYVREREATPGEKGYVNEAMLACDVYVPILKGDGDVCAVMVLTRVGRMISNRDETEIMGLAGQISLSLEKLEMYETTEEQRRMTQNMLDTIQEGVQLMNLEGQSLQVNQKLYEIMALDHAEAELNGVTLHRYLDLLATRVEESDKLFAFIEQAIKGDTNHVQSLNYVMKGAEQRYIQIYCEPIYRNKQKFGVLLVHRDITKEHEADRMKSEFVSTVSHELRTPLASILGFSELLLHREMKPERQHKYMATIHQEAKRLTQLVNDFLDLQRMENGKQFYDFGSIDIVALIEEVKELQQASTSQHTLSFSASSESMTVIGDRDKLFQVFVNLFNNAIKYSPTGGSVTIKARQEGDKARIDVTDEGLGIPEQAIPNLFTKFYRVDNSDRREIGGTGLGLSIVKEIVSQHKGDLSVRSQLGAGSTFTVMLPIEAGEASGMEAINEASVALTDQGSDSTHVMLVENDPNLSVMLQDELVEKGYRTTVFLDGASAMRAIEEQSPDIVILDLKLEPDMSGWEIIERMKASERLAGIPIIISSAFEEKDKALQLGVEHFLIKPYVPYKLIETIETILCGNAITNSIVGEKSIDS